MTTAADAGKPGRRNGPLAALRDYLNAPTATSARQARAQQAYRGWQRFQRNWTAILQGILMMVSGGFLYLVVGYWLAGQISGPNVPVLNIDVAPLIALLIVLAGLLVLLQNYFTRPAGAIIFRGRGVEFSFPFRSALDVQQIYEFVDLVQKAAQRNGGQSDAESP